MYISGKREEFLCLEHIYRLLSHSLRSFLEIKFLLDRNYKHVICAGLRNGHQGLIHIRRILSKYGSNLLINSYEYNENGRLKTIEPFKDGVDQIMLVNALLFQLIDNLNLRCDRRMVGTRLPQCLIALHSLKSD